MASIVTCSQQGSQLNIAIAGRFDFSILQDFRNAYTLDINAPIDSVLIDLTSSEHMDSSGMGLLLTLKKELQLDAGCVELVNCRPHIRDALLAARLDHFFKVN
jgi:anti-anti-sigma factor|tara:strand:- start:59 stop:367 length:309 start_codon:yes stop_codon:yes gene_type:complete